MCKICGLDCSFNDKDTPDWSKISYSPAVSVNFDAYKNAQIINRHIAYREEKAYERLKQDFAKDGYNSPNVQGFLNAKALIDNIR